MKLTMHFHYPLRDKIVQSHRVYPFLSDIQTQKYLNKFMDDMKQYTNRLGFHMNVKIEESDGKL